MVRFAAVTGLRAGEMAGLYVGDIRRDDDDGKISYVRVERTLQNIDASGRSSSRRPSAVLENVPILLKARSTPY